MFTAVVIIGAVCVIAAIIGEALKASEIELPAVTRKTPRILLAVFGLALIAIGLAPAGADLLRGPSAAESPPVTTGPPGTAISPAPPGPTESALPGPASIIAVNEQVSPDFVIMRVSGERFSPANGCVSTCRCPTSAART